jgi:hypothetical protein
MRTIDVEVFDDQSRPGGGHAVILLCGLEGVPPRSVVRIRPLDSVPLAEVAGTRRELDRLPVAMRSTDRGVELVVGPEVVDNPQLLPGTATLVEVPAADVRGEVLWPRLLPAARPRRRHLGVVRGERPGGDAGKAALAAAEATSEMVSRVAVAPLAPAAPSLAPSIAAADPAPVAVPTIARGAIATTTAGTGSAAGAAHDLSGGGSASDGDRGAKASGTSEPSAAAREQASTSTGAIAKSELAETGAAVTLVAAEQPTAPASLSNRAATLGDGPAPGPASATSAALTEGSPPKPRSRWRGLAAVAAAAAAMLAGVAVLGPFSGPAETSQSAIGRVERSMLETLAPASVSPAGARALAADRSTALERADALLNPAVGRRNTAEAAYWLRQHLATTLGDPRNTWALTQLGSTLAEPTDGEPDLAGARRLWEIAGAYGDPIALCFLGKMHELGLGVPPDRGRALANYRRAKAAGGCPDADAAITRLQR